MLFGTLIKKKKKKKKININNEIFIYDILMIKNII